MEGPGDERAGWPKKPGDSRVRKGGSRGALATASRFDAGRNQQGNVRWLTSLVRCAQGLSPLFSDQSKRFPSKSSWRELP